jgi:hypothetical protein
MNERLSLLKYHRLSLLKNHMLSFYVRLIYSNILAASTYGVYINLLIRYSGGCSSYHDFIDIGLLLTMKLLKQGFLVKSTTYLVNRYGISVSQNKNNHGYILFVVITIRSCSHSWLITWENTTSVTCWAGAANPPWALELSPGFRWGSCCTIFSFLCNDL